MSEKRKVTPKVIGVVWKHWKPSFKQNWFFLCGTVIAWVCIIAVELYRPTQWKQVFDLLTLKQEPWKPFGYIMGAYALGYLMHRIFEFSIVTSESKIIKSLKDYTVNKLLQKSTQFFTDHSSGGLVAKSKRFAHVSEIVIDELIISVLRPIVVVVYLVFYSYFQIPQLFWVFIIWIITFSITTTFLSRKRLKYDLASAEADSVTTASISDILLSVFTLRVFSAIPKSIKTFEQITTHDWQSRRQTWFFGNLQWAVQGLFVIFLDLFCMYIIIKEVLAGTYSIGTAVLVQSYIISLGMYMWNLGRSLIKVRTAFADAYEMASLLEERESEPTEEEKTPLQITEQSISFSNVSFGYQDSHPVLQNFSFDFKSGRKYGLIGRTGSGKSTITKLILRAYDHTSGLLTISGVSINTIHKMTLRSWVSYVPQDPQFPSLTIREIITLSKPNASFEEIREAAQKASCDFIWEKLSKGFDTIVGERGVRLSGGERQRIAIAAAILKDAPIVIMDEPTSALDAKTEASIQNAINKCFENKTLIIIAHRLSTVALLDEIILLDNGNIKAVGNHHSLLEESSEYRELWELQTKTDLGMHT